MSNHKQASLYKDTHELVEEIIEHKLDEGKKRGLSKASIIHTLVANLHRDVIGGEDDRREK